ncbi:MAG TPA: hypothetical protein VER12_09005 [Polyangiaceae bacterium]|nr:hypothetical protein [Polyangiaceae bacterium]
MKARHVRARVALLVGMAALASCRSPDISGTSNRSQANTARPVGHPHGAQVYRGLEVFRVSPDGKQQVAADNTGRFGRSWSKSTNLGLDLLTQLVAERVELASGASSAEHIAEVLSTLEGLRTLHGLFPEFIKLEGTPRAEVKGGTIRYSTLDSAWVTLALSIVEARYQQARPELARRARALIEQQQYSAFIRSALLSDGMSIDAVSGAVVEPARFSYGDRNSEARPLILALIGLGLLPPSAWEHMSYTWSERMGLPVASGYRASAFVELTGQLFFDEMALAPASLGVSHRNYVEASARVARAKTHVIWGYAPSCDPPDGYGEFGLDRPDVVTPYAAAELATTGSSLAARNLDRVLEALTWNGKPVADALDPKTARILCPDARMLDQSLLFLALHVQALRDLARATAWYAPAEARLREMDSTHRPPTEPAARQITEDSHWVGR